MTWQARLPVMVTKSGGLMIIATPCPHRDPG